MQDTIRLKNCKKNYIDEGKQEEAIELAKETMDLLVETLEIYMKDLILNSDIELCVDKNELSYKVPKIYRQEN